MYTAKEVSDSNRLDELFDWRWAPYEEVSFVKCYASQYLPKTKQLKIQMETI
jgi:hypothetical protein